MKILIITNLYKPFNRGGAERVVEQQIEWGMAEGDEVVVFTARPLGVSGLMPRMQAEAAPMCHPERSDSEVEGSHSPDEKILRLCSTALRSAQNNMIIYHIYPFNIFFYTNDTKKHPILRFVWHIIDTFNLHTFFAALYLIKKERPDEIHTHNLKGIGFLIPLAIRVMRVPWTHTVHDIQLITPSGLMLTGEENHWQHTGFLTRAFRAICRLLFGSPSNVMFLSNWCKDEYEKYGFFTRSKKIVQRLTADPIFSIVVPSFLSKTTYLERNARRITYAGQLEPHKGIQWLLEQATKNPHYDFHLYGDGSLLPYAREIADKHPHIHVYGTVQKQALATALRLSKYFVYPSLTYENCPLAILEAQAAGCIIIAPSQGGIEELLTHTDITLNIKKDLTSQL